MSQLRIDYENSNARSIKNDANTHDSSPTFRVLSGRFCEGSLAHKARKLQRINPKFAALLESLMDDALREGKGRKL